jgi:hypothetical protein
MDVERAHFGTIEWAGTAAAENRYLVSGFIDGAVAVYAL